MTKKKNPTKWKSPEIVHNKLSEWNWMIGHPLNLHLGKNVDIGAFTYINARYHVWLMDNVQIGAHCSIYSHNTINDTKGSVIIKKGAKIGANSVILPGVIIKEGQLIKANSVVHRRKDIIYARSPTLYSYIETVLKGDDKIE